MKRVRIPKPTRGRLEARWGRDEPGEYPAIVYVNGGGGVGRPDAALLADALERAPIFDGKSLVQVLKERGYDLTTLRFRVDKPEVSQ